SASTDAPCRPANRSEAALPVKGKAYGATIPPAPGPRGRRAARQEVGAPRSGSAFWLISCRSFLTARRSGSAFLAVLLPTRTSSARRSDSAVWLISCRLVPRQHVDQPVHASQRRASSPPTAARPSWAPSSSQAAPH